MQRRDFLLGCSAGAALAAEQGWAQAVDARPRTYRRARLVDDAGRALHAREVPVNQNLLFHYPFAGTPAFLLNLGKPTRAGSELRTERREAYRWPGGVGPARSIVAFSAICAHRLAYPTREISFISFRDDTGPRRAQPQLIHCCSENSQYDPADGARVIAGPAPQPLAAVLLEHVPETDELFAVGTLGGEMFDAFFEKYRMRLSLEHGARAREEVGGSCTVVPMTTYCRQQVRC